MDWKGQPGAYPRFLCSTHASQLGNTSATVRRLDPGTHRFWMPPHIFRRQTKLDHALVRAEGRSARRSEDLRASGGDSILPRSSKFP